MGYEYEASVAALNTKQVIPLLVESLRSHVRSIKSNDHVIEFDFVSDRNGQWESDGQIYLYEDRVYLNFWVAGSQREELISVLEKCLGVIFEEL